MEVESVLNIKHLHESTQKLLELPKSERIQKIRDDVWIGYPEAQRILDKLDKLLNHPKIHRMPNLLIVGPTNAGKTTIINRFLKLHPAHDNVWGDEGIVPILTVECPPVPDESRMYTAILSRLFVPHKPHDHVDTKRDQVLKVLQRLNVRVLALDEIHNILAGHPTKQRQMLNTIKYLGNTLQIPIVAVGTVDALRAINSDPQLSNRFEPCILDKWAMGDDFLKLLKSFEMLLPLKKPSHLVRSDIADKLLSMSEGNLGAIASILKEAAIKAIEIEVECINEKILNKIDWKPVSKRKAILH